MEHGARIMKKVGKPKRQLSDARSIIASKERNFAALPAKVELILWCSLREIWQNYLPHCKNGWPQSRAALCLISSINSIVLDFVDVVLDAKDADLVSRRCFEMAEGAQRRYQRAYMKGAKNNERGN